VTMRTPRFTRVCDRCDQRYRMALPVCPYCGHDPEDVEQLTLPHPDRQCPSCSATALVDRTDGEVECDACGWVSVRRQCGAP